MPPDNKDDTYEAEGFARRRRLYQEMREQRTSGSIGPIGGGSQTFNLQIEVQQDYINAQYVSALIVAAAVIEQSLFHQVISIDSSKRGERWTLKEVLDGAVDYDIIPADVTDAFDSLKDIADLRNGVVHYREGHEDPIFRDQFENFDEYHPNRHGRKFAERMIRAMFEILDKCSQNQRDLFEGKGPLTQGIDTHKHGKAVDCPNCGANLQDRELDYRVDWDGTSVREEVMLCPECGENVAEAIRASQRED